MEHRYSTIDANLPIIMWFGCFQNEGEWLYYPKGSSTPQIVSSGYKTTGRTAVLTQQNLNKNSNKVSKGSFRVSSPSVTSVPATVSSSINNSNNKKVVDSAVECNNTLKQLLHQLNVVSQNEKRTADLAEKTQVAALLEIAIRSSPAEQQHKYQQQLIKLVDSVLPPLLQNSSSTVDTNNNTLDTDVDSVLQVAPDHYFDDLPVDVNLVMEELNVINEEYITNKFPRDTEENRILQEQALDLYRRSEHFSEFRTISIKFGSLQQGCIYRIKAYSSYEDSQEEFTDVGDGHSIPLNDAIVYIREKYAIGSRTSTFYDGIVCYTQQYYLVQLTYVQHGRYEFFALDEDQTGNVTEESPKKKTKKTKN